MSLVPDHSRSQHPILSLCLISRLFFTLSICMVCFTHSVFSIDFLCPCRFVHVPGTRPRQKSTSHSFFLFGFMFFIVPWSNNYFEFPAFFSLWAFVWFVSHTFSIDFLCPCRFVHVHGTRPRQKSTSHSFFVFGFMFFIVPWSNNYFEFPAFFSLWAFVWFVTHTRLVDIKPQHTRSNHWLFVIRIKSLTTALTYCCTRWFRFFFTSVVSFTLRLFHNVETNMTSSLCWMSITFQFVQCWSLPLVTEQILFFLQYVSRRNQKAAKLGHANVLIKPCLLKL